MELSQYSPDADGQCLVQGEFFDGFRFFEYMGLSENVGYIPNEIAIFHTG